MYEQVLTLPGGGLAVSTIYVPYVGLKVCIKHNIMSTVYHLPVPYRSTAPLQGPAPQLLTLYLDYPWLCLQYIAIHVSKYGGEYRTDCFDTATAVSRP